MTDGMRHEILVERLVDEYGCRRRGFAKELAGYMGASGVCSVAEARAMMPRIVPDAWTGNWEAREVTVFEVEDSHPLDDKAMKKWTLLWGGLDAYDWTLRLIRVTRWGQLDEVFMDSAFAEFHWGRTNRADRHDQSQFAGAEGF